MRNGFTLIELAIVLTITSIVALFSISSFHNFRTFQQTCYITQSLNQSIYYARLYAVIKNTPVTLSPINNNWQNGWVIKTDGVNLKYYPKMPAEIKFNNSKNNALKILPDGTTDGYFGHYLYNQTKLVINRGGRTRVDKKT